MDSLPNEIGLLTSLEKLNVSNNGLATLPDSIPGVKKLANNNVAFMQRGDILPTNQVELNSQVVGLRNLKELNLSQNSFIILPMYFEALVKMEKIDLSDTHEIEIPEQLLELDQLRELVFKNNFPNLDEERHNKLINKGVLIVGVDSPAPENNLANNAAANLESQETTVQDHANDLAVIGGPAQNRAQSPQQEPQQATEASKRKERNNQSNPPNAKRSRNVSLT